MYFNCFILTILFKIALAMDFTRELQLNPVAGFNSFTIEMGNKTSPVALLRVLKTALKS